MRLHRCNALRRIGPPEVAADDLGHFHVVREKALIDGGERPHGTGCDQLRINFGSR